MKYFKYFFIEFCKALVLLLIAAPFLNSGDWHLFYIDGGCLFFTICLTGALWTVYISVLVLLVILACMGYSLWKGK